MAGLLEDGWGRARVLGETDGVDWVLPGWLMELSEQEAWGWGSARRPQQ